MNPVHQLRRNDAFKKLDGSDLETIAQSFRYRTFPIDWPLVEQDKKVEHIGLIVEGSARIFIRDRHEQEQVCGHVNAGEFILDISLLVGQTALITTSCTEPLVCLVQSRSDFLNMLKNHPDLKDFFYCLIMRRFLEDYRIVWGHTHFDQINPVTSKRLPKSIMKSMAYIERYYDHHLTLGNIARESGMSRYYFSRLFKSYTGYSFKEYLNLKRIEAAKNFMVQEGMNVSEACFRAGYNNVSYFSRIFKSYEGVLPSLFLKNLKE